MKFGVSNLSLFSGMVYEEKHQEERTVTAEQARQLVKALQTAGAIDGLGKVQLSAKIEEIALPQELEEVREMVQAVMEQAAPITAQSLIGTACTATVVEEKSALKTGTLELPKKYESVRSRFEAIIANADGQPPVRDASRDVTVRLDKQVMLSPEFLELCGQRLSNAA